MLYFIYKELSVKTTVSLLTTGYKNNRFSRGKLGGGYFFVPFVKTTPIFIIPQRLYSVKKNAIFNSIFTKTA